MEEFNRKIEDVAQLTLVREYRRREGKDTRVKEKPWFNENQFGKPEL